MSEQDIIRAKLDELRKQLAAEELQERKAEERRRQRRERGKPVVSAAQRPPSRRGEDTNTESAEAAAAKTVPASPAPTRGQTKRLTKIEATQIRIALLEELNAKMEAQSKVMRDNFRVMQTRAERSSRQGVWLTVGSSVITLILGWLLSLLGSPATLVHAFGR